MSYNNLKELECAIDTLELEKAEGFKSLLEQIQLTSESMNPLNVIRDKLHEIVSNQEVKKGLIDSALILATNYLTEKIKPKQPMNKLSALLISFLEFSIIKYIRK